MEKHQGNNWNMENYSVNKLSKYEQRDVVRATQIGTMSRGADCAGFNSPAIFGSVKMSFEWIKQVIEEEMEGKGYCQRKKKKN